MSGQYRSADGVEASLWQRVQRRTLSLSALAMIALVTRPAHAVPGETRAGLELGAAAFSTAALSPTLGVRGAYGLVSNWELQLEASGVWLQHGVRPLVTQVVPAIAYRFDVVRWVPFVRAGAGVAVDWQRSGVSGVASGALGIEYLWDRSLASGVAYQVDFGMVRSGDLFAAIPLHRVMLGITWSSGW